MLVVYNITTPLIDWCSTSKLYLQYLYYTIKKHNVTPVHTGNRYCTVVDYRTK